MIREVRDDAFVVEAGAVMQILEKDFADRLAKATGKPYAVMLTKVHAYNNKLG